MKRILICLLVLLFSLPMAANAAVEHDILSIWRRIDALTTGRDDLRAAIDIDARLAMALLRIEDEEAIDPAALGVVGIGDVDQYMAERAAEEAAAAAATPEPVVEEPADEQPASDPADVPPDEPAGTNGEDPAAEVPVTDTAATEKSADVPDAVDGGAVESGEPAAGQPAQDAATMVVIMDASAPIPSNLKTLAVSSKGEDVERLQAKLIELGLLSDVADGRYGQLTRDAVRAFQDINQNGTADICLQIVLRNLAADDPAVAALTELKKNDEGEDVLLLQRALRGRNLNAGESGLYDEATEQAVEAYKKGLAYGQADVYTQMRILTALAIQPGEAPISETEDVPEVSEADGLPPEDMPGDMPNETEEPSTVPEAPAEDAAAAPVETGSRELKPGDSGADVLVLQQRLAELGYYEGELSGVYDEATTAAVERFQMGGIILGVADVETQRRIFAEPQP